MTRQEIKGLTKRRKGEPYAERRLRAMIRVQVPYGWPYSQDQWERVGPLLKELKMRRDLANEKQLSL